MANEEWVLPRTISPPPMYVGQKERDFSKQVTQELVEKVIGQVVLYYSISLSETNFHPVYGEAIVKTFLPPIKIHILVEWHGQSVDQTGYGVDEKNTITIHFFKRRLVEDQDLYARIGDFVLYGNKYYEIVKLSEPREQWGQWTNKVEITAECLEARQGLFDAT